jgi:hypothetical protein
METTVATLNARGWDVIAATLTCSTSQQATTLRGTLRKAGCGLHLLLLEIAPSLSVSMIFPMLMKETGANNCYVVLNVLTFRHPDAVAVRVRTRG